MTGGIPPDPAATGGEQCDHFIAMYSRYYDEVLRYAWRRVGPDYAAEVVSETFTVAWRRAGSCRSTSCPGSTRWRATSSPTGAGPKSARSTC
nr:hypothetical protein GCM10020093_004210 [Planobispora longispora]